MRLLLALLLLAVSASHAADNAGTQVELACSALVPHCLTQNQPLLDAGDPRAQFWMGRYIFLTNDHAFDEALPWYQQAAAQNYAPALVMAAIYHWHGVGQLSRNRSEAISLMRQAVAANYGPARNLLSYMEDSRLSDQQLAMLIRF